MKSQLTLSALVLLACASKGYTAVNSNATNTNSPIQIGLSGLFAAGGSSIDNEKLNALQSGGHDPNRNGFIVQNVEMTIGAIVDPYFDAQANLIYQIDSQGETVVELEEAYLTTTGLPSGLQVKGGQFFTEFGRQNTQHPHTWSFADQPVVLSRLFSGDGLRSQGLRLSWLMPIDWYSEFIIALQNANGETVTSFLGVPGDDIAGHVLMQQEARNFSDLLYSTRWMNGFDVSSHTSVNMGLSGLFGPNGSGDTSTTQIYGLDAYMKWQPDYTQRGFPFVAWQSEFLYRNYEAQGNNTLNAETLHDWGGYTQIVWGYKPGRVVGVRYELADSNSNDKTDSLRDKRHRLALNYTWYPTEYSKLRVQYNLDKAEHLEEDFSHGVWLQVEFNIGSHAAHTF